ncbi:MAG: glycosyltransferase family 1 protein, partial [Streptosporangiaceae bacterium]
EAAAPAARRGAAALPDITAFLDDAFGPAPAIAARGGTAAGPSARTGTNAAAGRPAAGGAAARPGTSTGPPPGGAAGTGVGQ